MLTQAIEAERRFTYEILIKKASYKMSGQFYILLEVRNVKFRHVRQRIVKQQHTDKVVCPKTKETLH